MQIWNHRNQTHSTQHRCMTDFVFFCVNVNATGFCVNCHYSERTLGLCTLDKTDAMHHRIMLNHIWHFFDCKANSSFFALLNLLSLIRSRIAFGWFWKCAIWASTPSETMTAFHMGYLVRFFVFFWKTIRQKSRNLSNGVSISHKRNAFISSTWNKSFSQRSNWFDRSRSVVIPNDDLKIADNLVITRRFCESNRSVDQIYVTTTKCLF